MVMGSSALDLKGKEGICNESVPAVFFTEVAWQHQS